MSTGVNKLLRRQDITFEEKDQSLRDDVRTLGAMVGDLIREQNGPELYELVENARLRAIRRREGNEKPGEELSALVRELNPHTASQLIRSFSTYFQMVNTAEKVHRIRRRREYLRDADVDQPGGLEDTLLKLKASGMEVDGLEALFDSMLIEPVFTAHPTEPTRRTILRKEQNIVKHLVELLNPTMTPHQRWIDSIQSARSQAFGPSRAGMMAPRQSGQSPQPSPDPVLRTMTPMTIIT